MRAHYLQHVPFEGLGSIETWLLDAGHELSFTRWFESGKLPGPNQVDLLIVMGGPMSVHDEIDHPWLAQEKAFIQEVITSGKPVLGICLGAQLIASAMGAKVYPNWAKEIGWFPVHDLTSASEGVFDFPATLQAFHWHGETFDLPPGSQRIARSGHCLNQGFSLGDRVIGLQFHLETTPVSARAIASNCRDELIPNQFVQSETELLSQPPECYVAINMVMGEVLAYLTSTVPKPPV